MHDFHMEIESWLRSGEAENIEFKRTTGERREAVRTVCVRKYARYLPFGVILILCSLGLVSLRASK